MFLDFVASSNGIEMNQCKDREIQQRRRIFRKALLGFAAVHANAAQLSVAELQVMNKFWPLTTVEKRRQVSYTPLSKVIPQTISALQNCKS
ncbi:hypothetical protein Nepgr_017904 [Nepenthes gracilis]|uniref:Uncharacterized protein n=1 Tax=Nepenthes gracilis TaxID=150966 RepID=A0AAD3XSY2_NEPGR|nr:hypothetical protein Nepgr_017904 [Nepenthes gracilis]